MKNILIKEFKDLNIAIIDADIIGRRKHRFPNLASMKLSAYHKSCGDNVTLITDYNQTYKYDKCYVSKVFTATQVPDDLMKRDNVICGGTGFFYDKAEPLPNEIEHIMPDYHLYDSWISEKIQDGARKSHFDMYRNYSIGFLTRGCFRQCPFCVNQHYTRCVKHSNISEFLDTSRKKICLLDDNFLACPEWKGLIEEVKKTGKRFQFQQGLDERLLTEDKCAELASWKYDKEFIFAFDDINDYDLIEKKLKILRKHIKKQCKFYTLCGYDRNNVYDIEFWIQDIINTFRRIELLGSYRCLPYIMRHANYELSPYRGIYIAIAMWCNTPSMFKTQSFEGFAKKYDTYIKRKSKILEYYELASSIPEIDKYLHRCYFIK